MTLKVVPPRTKPPRRTKRTAEYKAEGLVLLEVTPDAVAASPRIEHLFKGIGGQRKVFEYLAGSEEPEARTLVVLRARLTQRQAQSVPFEAYCVAAGIPVKKMFGVIAAEVADQESRATELLFRSKHKDVVQATIDVAMMQLGTQEKKMLHQAAKFVPVSKNTITHIHGDQLIDARHQTANVAVLPPLQDTVKRISDRFNAMMVAPAPAIMDANAEDDDEDSYD